ncbi:flavin oxidoreductase [Psychrosphaera saromensis]|uniref:Flavin oxidoreductase n=1 Tax=Psychrosphaera saromensis TaxID=716813 RepID=A0A2S7UUJ1_9GAMM|nr:flavin reductase [Psychrosphaera saromensis]PQJ52940.1 flavin oxidoreductase [Psychrosphaera saromensis]GHB77757.1 flavin oxidoreductase [Psychrosphaera saromensis]GLQ12904.1 flavin oxidoreductase [Psychrosphaera saromensis]
MQHFNNDDLTEMATRYRVQLINSLSGFKSANLIGTRDKQGNNNLAIFSSVFHLGSSPALVGFIMRPDSVSRHTLDNIQQTKQYTINQVSDDFWRKAHQSSARYLSEQSEFEHVGLTPEFVNNVTAPFVKESRLKYALTVKEITPIELNNTLLIIGEITDVICEETAIKDDGYIDIESLNTVAISGLDSYHTTQRLSRISYAKPDKSPMEIPLNGVNE